MGSSEIGLDLDELPLFIEFLMNLGKAWNQVHAMLNKGCVTLCPCHLHFKIS